MKLSLRGRILLVVAALAILSIGGGLFSVWYSYQTNLFFKTVVDENMSALAAADRLEATLIMQKGYLTYFFQDRNPRWLRDLDRYTEEFLKWLSEARKWSVTPDGQGILQEIDTYYAELTGLRDRAIALYKAENIQEGFRVHQSARRVFFNIMDLAQRFRHIHENRIAEARAEIDRRAVYMTGLALAAMPLALLLSGVLTWILIRQVLEPISRLVRETSPMESEGDRSDEVRALSRGVHHLMEDMGQTRSELEVSRMHLVQAAKMASVGKLSASVAHTIRNPLTSVKMRLFSLERGLDLTESQRDDFKVISEEIRHIDNILRNFLEFSRRPRLKVQRISPSEVVDLAVQLIHPRLESHGIKLELKRSERLPEINIDPDQLKEALINLLVNASEAVEKDGLIVVEEDSVSHSASGRLAVIQVKDNGSGISQALREQIFQPFFSTKDQGAGLGLTIAMRIVEEHGGQLEVENLVEGGACFKIILPVRETWR